MNTSAEYRARRAAECQARALILFLIALPFAAFVLVGFLEEQVPTLPAIVMAACLIASAIQAKAAAKYSRQAKMLR